MLFLLFLLPTSAFSEIYKCQTEDGRVVYVNVPRSVDGQVDYKNVPRSDCSLPGQNVLGARWKALGHPDNRLYFDLESFVLLPKQNSRKAWLLKNVTKNPSNSNTGYQSMKWRVVINCSNKTYINTQYTFFEGLDGFGKIINSSDETSTKRMEPTPESIMELAVNELCKRNK